MILTPAQIENCRLLDLRRVLSNQETICVVKHTNNSGRSFSEQSGGPGGNAAIS
jgi:hypothetical protein